MGKIIQAPQGIIYWPLTDERQSNIS